MAKMESARVSSDLHEVKRGVTDDISGFGRNLPESLGIQMELDSQIKVL